MLSSLRTHADVHQLILTYLRNHAHSHSFSPHRTALHLTPPTPPPASVFRFRLRSASGWADDGGGILEYQFSVAAEPGSAPAVVVPFQRSPVAGVQLQGALQRPFVEVHLCVLRPFQPLPLCLPLSVSLSLARTYTHIGVSILFELQRASSVCDV